ncbi:hypothetical protein H5410_009068 [Solanum commersonii]|uniref:Uncharacterized protein n=1 Tax=Solanum commersonii TaxID=4109 RepID=A0A9J6AIG2_SOLCO|nr:hypothetical protein H5410_009068 [Solanum commersonii]
MAAGLHSGWTPLSKAAIPLTCGHDMDVPEIMLNSTRLSSSGNPVGPTSPVQPARILIPGAMISGLSISGVMEFGPLELNAPRTGDGWIPTFVPPKRIVAVGLGSDVKYFLIASPAI